MPRNRMKPERKSITHGFKIGQHEGSITAGKYDDGAIGEVFLRGMGKEGSTLVGLADALSIAMSIGLQYGVPLETYHESFDHVKFEPSGETDNPNIKYAKSIPDYLTKWLMSQESNV